MINWFKKKDKIEYYTLSKYLNRYQIQIYDYNKDMIYLGLHEGFTFDQACEGALEELKKQIDIKTIHTPIRFFYSGVKYN